MQISTADIPKLDISIIQRPLRKELDSIHQDVLEINSGLQLLHTDLAKRALPEHVAAALTTLASDSLLEQEVQQQLVRHRSKPGKGAPDTSALHKSTEQLGERLFSMCEAIRVVFQLNAKTQQRILQLEQRQDDLPSLVKREIAKVEQQLNLAQRNLRQSIKDDRGQLQNSLNQLRNNFSELQRNTLWRIKDCESKMESRVNGQYVQDCMKELEGRVTAIATASSKPTVDVNEIDRLARLARKLQDQTTEQKILNNGRFKTIEQRITNKLVEKETFMKVSSDIRNKFEPQIEQLRNRTMQQKIYIDENTAMIRSLDKGQKEAEDQIRGLKGVVKTLKMSEELQKFVATFDIHKICQIDAALQRLRQGHTSTAKTIDDLRKLVEKINSVRASADSEKKAPVSEGKINREDIERVVMELNFRTRTSQNSEMAKQIELMQGTIRNVQKNVMRTMKSFDEKKLVSMINGVDEYAKREVMVLTTRLNGLEQALAECKKKLTVLLTQEKKESEDYSIIGVKKLYPVESCIGCVKK